MFEKLKKRRCYPVPGLDGVFVRLFTQGEKPRFNALDGEAKGQYLFGTVLVNEDGSQCCPRIEGETEADWLARVETEMSDVDDGVLLLIRDAVNTLIKGEQVPVEDIVKN